MKNAILISINPNHVKNILNGTKKFEYRTRVANREVSSMLIYETAPTKKIVAEVEIKSIIKMPPKELWNRTSAYSGIALSFFNEYFQDRNIAYAYELGKVRILDKPLELKDIGMKAAPQSFVYLKIK